MAKSSFCGISLLLLFSDLLQAISSNSSPADASLPLLRVPLHREVVPVHRKGKVVSSKISFSGALSIGHPPQAFRAVMDTGSGHVIVPSDSCLSKACALHRRYNLSASSTGVAINADGSQVDNSELADQLTIGFGTGEVLGEFAKERVCLWNNSTAAGNEQAAEPSCVDVNIVTAVEMSEQPFSTFSFDGILGLSLNGLAFSPEFSFFQAWASRSADPGRRQFAFFLTDDDDKKSSSELIIGGHDTAHMLNPLSWAPVTLPDMGFWQLQIKAIRVSGVELDFCRAGDCRGVFDTGTSHLGVPAPFDQELLQLLTVPEAALGAQAGEPDCRSAALPVLQIEVAGLNLTLEPQHYMRKMPLPKDVRLSESGGIVAEPEASPSRLRRALPDAASSSERFCRPRLMPVKLPAPLGPKLFLFGEPLLQRYYTVFDWESQQIGLALSSNRRNVAEAEQQRAEKERQERLERQHQEELSRRPQQVDDIILLQLPKKAALSKTAVAVEESEHDCDEDGTCSA